MNPNRQARPGAALVLENGRIWTGDGFARSVVIRGNRIASLDEVTPADAEVIDLRGRLVVPGFVDNHVHFSQGSFQLDQVRLRDAATPEELVRRIGEYAARAGAGRWISGGEWDEQQWSPPLPPARWLIDEVTPRNPVFVTRLDLHLGLANSVALRLAGITRETPAPPGGVIDRDGRGEPTGILRDAAMQRVVALIPPPTAPERMAALRKGLREAARCGVTSFCDMVISAAGLDDLPAWQSLEQEGELTARVWIYLPVELAGQLPRLGNETGLGSSRLRIGGLKGFADGSLGSSTAAFLEPYLDDPDNAGLLMQPILDGSMARWIDQADAGEIQLAIHAIGDRANREVLALFESRPGHRVRRYRIEHAQHLDPSLIRRLAHGRVIASVQPFHAIDDGRWAESKIGKSRAAMAFPFRSLLDQGVMTTFGSDWPVAPLDPIAGIAAAVTRRTLDGRNPDGWFPEQRITVAEALRCYTANSAWSVFAEGEIGTIAPGMFADFAVLSGDLFTLATAALEDVRVEMTLFDGRVIYET
ncbi:MAG TPA: amidohydrolase [Thermoanaerobaculia bacterium]|nr:amidohydrolase [Thermoanaerobaculia bacterium]